MKVLLHGRLAEMIGAKLELEARAGSTIAELRASLAARYPAAAAILASGRSSIWVGGSRVPDDFIAGATDEIEFLPPVSGG